MCFSHFLSLCFVLANCDCSATILWWLHVNLRRVPNKWYQTFSKFWRGVFFLVEQITLKTVRRFRLKVKKLIFIYLDLFSLIISALLCWIYWRRWSGIVNPRCIPWIVIHQRLTWWNLNTRIILACGDVRWWTHWRRQTLKILCMAEKLEKTSEKTETSWIE